MNKHNTLRLLAATIEAIFTVCDWPNIKVRQCLLSLKKWEELMVGLVQTVLGLTVNMNKLTVRITLEYWDQVRQLLVLYWPISWWILKVTNIQKLVGKLTWLGKGALWIYKIMLHIFTSLTFALKQNKELLVACSLRSCEIVGNIDASISLKSILRLPRS